MLGLFSRGSCTSPTRFCAIDHRWIQFRNILRKLFPDSIQKQYETLRKKNDDLNLKLNANKKKKKSFFNCSGKRKIILYILIIIILLTIIHISRYFICYEVLWIWLTTPNPNINDLKSFRNSLNFIVSNNKISHYIGKRSSTNTNTNIDTNINTNSNSNANTKDKLSQIEATFLHGWYGYYKNCLGFDELYAMDGTCSDWLGHYSTTLIDSLSSLYIMNFEREWNLSMRFLTDSNNFDAFWSSKLSFSERHFKVSYFETHIRLLGGLLSAYDLSGEKELLFYAKNLGDIYKLGELYYYPVKQHDSLQARLDDQQQREQEEQQEKSNKGPSSNKDILNRRRKRRRHYVRTIPHFMVRGINLKYPWFYGHTNFGLGRESLENDYFCKFITTKLDTTYSSQSSCIIETTVAIMGSIQIENYYLSQFTDNTVYSDIGDDVINYLYHNRDYLRNNNLFAITYYYNRGDRDANNAYAMGGNGNHIGSGADSFYEYLLKYWIILESNINNSKDPLETKEFCHRLRVLYLDSVIGIKETLWKDFITSNGEKIGAITDGPHGNPKVSHLTCFASAMLALGTIHNITRNDTERLIHLNMSKDFAEICVRLYFNMPTGLSPDSVLVAQSNDKTGNDKRINMVVAGNGQNVYLLRPEVIESLFYLYRITKDNKYREYGWKIYLSIEKYCRTEYGYTPIKNVDNLQRVKQLGDMKYNKNKGSLKRDDERGRQHSFFFSETLKYLYLLFSDENVLPLDKFVFNTEGHPFRLFKT